MANIELSGYERYTRKIYSKYNVIELSLENALVNEEILLSEYYTYFNVWVVNISTAINIAAKFNDDTNDSLPLFEGKELGIHFNKLYINSDATGNPADKLVLFIGVNKQTREEPI